MYSPKLTQSPTVGGEALGEKQNEGAAATQLGTHAARRAWAAERRNDVVRQLQHLVLVCRRTKGRKEGG